MKNDVIQLPFDVELLPVTPLKAGDLTCLYEQGNLRYIKQGDVELVRMMYGAVRDETWNTAPYKIEGESMQVNSDNFYISYTAFYTLNDIRYKAFFTIEGRENMIVMRMKGEALSSFSRNRIGLCVHHPITECTGENVTIEQPDGTNYSARFSELISPHQPFLSIKKLHWKAAGQVACSLHFEGDVFETEDQRNWTDNSYKTYSTPLALSFPVQVKKGETIEQQILLEAASAGSKNVTPKRKPAVTDEKRLFPAIGYARPTDSPHLTETEIGLLRQIPFDQYRTELYFNKDWKTELQKAVSEAKQLGTSLELVLFFSDAVEKNLAEFVTFIEGESNYIKSILPLPASARTTTPVLLKSVYGVLKKLNAAIKIGYGTDGFFADLNRNHPQTPDYDFVSFSLNPQVHQSDTRSLLENLEAQADTIKTVTTFCGGKEIHVSPVTFKMRDDTHENGCGYDARQHTSFGAFWTLACLANLRAATCITFYQTIGPCGILARDPNSRLGVFPSPLYKALVHIKEFGPKWIKQNAAGNNIIMENEKGARLIYACDFEIQSVGVL